MSTPEQAYTPVRGDVAVHRNVLLSLWNGNLGDSGRMRAKFGWFYDACPNGAPLVELLRHEPAGEWVGACSAGRRRMCFQGREIDTAILVDLVVTPAHRSLGPALMMQMAMVQHVRTELDLLLGFPNPRAASLFKRIRYSNFKSISRHARVLRHGRYLESRMPRWAATPCGLLVDAAVRVRDRLRRGARSMPRTEWSDRVDPRMDELWQRSLPRSMLTAKRDGDFLRWRFDESPLARSRHLLVLDPRGEGLIAWFTTVREGHMLHIRDFWSVNAETGTPAICIDALLHAARREGVAAVSVEMATSEGRLASWASRGFVERNSRPVFGYWSAPPNAVDQHIDVHLTPVDEDE